MFGLEQLTTLLPSRKLDMCGSSCKLFPRGPMRVNLQYDPSNRFPSNVFEQYNACQLNATAVRTKQPTSQARHVAMMATFLGNNRLPSSWM